MLVGYLRLVIDHNRNHGDPTPITEISNGIVITSNLKLDETHADAWLNQVF
jgi:predicted N-formylglutamate amidohydrolase